MNPSSQGGLATKVYRKCQILYRPSKKLPQCASQNEHFSIAVAKNASYCLRIKNKYTTISRRCLKGLEVSENRLLTILMTVNHINHIS